MLLVLVNAVTGHLDATELHRRVVYKGVERADGVGPSPHAGYDNVRELPCILLHLGLHLDPHDQLEGAYDRGGRDADTWCFQ